MRRGAQPPLTMPNATLTLEAGFVGVLTLEGEPAQTFAVAEGGLLRGCFDESGAPYAAEVSVDLYFASYADRVDGEGIYLDGQLALTGAGADGQELYMNGVDLSLSVTVTVGPSGALHAEYGIRGEGVYVAD